MVLRHEGSATGGKKVLGTPEAPILSTLSATELTLETLEEGEV
jgi:hypothetical protein